MRIVLIIYIEYVASKTTIVNVSQGKWICAKVTQYQFIGVPDKVLNMLERTEKEKAGPLIIETLIPHGY